MMRAVLLNAQTQCHRAMQEHFLLMFLVPRCTGVENNASWSAQAHD
jgi:hypothetical protein